MKIKIIKKIIIVDDEMWICDSIKTILKLRDYTVTAFTNAQTALSYIACKISNTPDLMIVDYKLSGETGLELLKKIKQLNSFVSVIMISGYADKKLIIDSMRMGADDFIEKPFNDLQLYNSIEKIEEKKNSILQNLIKDNYTAYEYTN